MSVSLMGQERPPWIAFEERTEEDRDASREAGGIRFKTVNYIVIRQIGSKDSVEKIAEEWLAYKQEQAEKGSYPMDWVISHQKKYDAWKEGREAPPDGVPLKEWAGVSRAIAENCAQVGVYTVEDLAGANEETLRKIGMGARKYKDTAQAWLDSRLTHGNAEELAALRATVSDMEERDKQKDQLIQKLESRLELLESKPKRRKAG